MICHLTAPRQDKVRLHCLGKHISFDARTRAPTHIYAGSDSRTAFHDNSPESNTEPNTTQTTQVSQRPGGRENLGFTADLPCTRC